MVLIKKLLQLVATVVLVTLFASLLLELLPGDAAEVLAPSAGPERLEQLREQLHLNDSFVMRYGRWLGDFVQGDFGSYYTVSSDRPVADRLWASLPVSLLLMLYAQVLALLIAIPVGVLSAYRQGGWFDRISGASAFAMLAVPNFVLGFVLQYYLGVKLGWFKTGGYRSPMENFVEHVQFMILPTVTLAVGQVAVYQRLLRTDMIATLREDFILMAKAKGLKSKRILFRHALRPSSLTLLTVAGLNVGTLIGGALIVEVVFSLPGMGLMIFEAIGRRQIVAFQSMVAVIAVLYVLVNFAVDILYTVLDPRIRNSESK